MNKNKAKGQHIKVYVRVRPLNDAETRRGSDVIVDCASNNEVIVNERPTDRITRKFTFDKVFGPSSKQIEVYKNVACPLIKEVLDGYNCTVFAYGQTGTGKTYTMEGGKCGNYSMAWNTDSQAGIIPRALSHLFDELRLLQVEYSVKVSFLEIYNEELFDLLSPVDDTGKLRLFEDAMKKGAVIVNGLDEVAVRNKEEIYSLLARGSKKRQTAATLMNAVSSRSHTVFSVTVRLKENGVEDEVLRTGKLNLVDLAGSENIGRSGAVEKRAREAGNINQSLLTLGRVITALVEKTPHIPYRESKLTRLLQESLGGRTKTCIIATVSPSLCNIEETLSTLDYAHRAKNIQNKPEVNEKIGKIALIQEYIEEIHRLKADLTATREKTGVWLAEDNYNCMMSQIESQKKELSEMLGSMNTLTETLERKEELNKQLSESVEKYLQDLNETRHTLQETKEERDEHAFLLKHHIKTEQKLTKQAERLLSVADGATYDTSLLHETLDRKRCVEENNLLVCRNITNICKQKISGLREISSNMQESRIKSNKDLINMLDKGYTRAETSSEEMKESIDSALKAHKEITKRIHDLNESLTHQTRTRVESTISETTQNFQEHLQTLTLFLKEIVGKFEVASKAADETRKQTQAFTDSLASKIEEQERMVQKFVSSSRKQFDIVLEDLQKQEKLLMDLDTTAQHLKDREAKLDMHVKTAFEALQNIRNDSDGARPRLENITTMLANASLPTSNVKHLESGVALIKDTVETQRNNIQTIINEHTERSLPLTNEIEVVCSEGRQAAEDVMSKFPQLENKHIENLCEHMNGVTEAANCFRHKLKHHVEELHTHVSGFGDSQKININYNGEEQLKLVQECKSHIECDSEQLKLWNHSVTEKTCECETVLEKMVTDEIHADVPSGRTPQRREFSYPRDLVCTSPAERILSRFRSTRIPVSPLASSSFPVSHTQENLLLSENGSEECVQHESNSFSNVSTERSTLESTSQSVPSIPHAVLDKENSSSSTVAAKLKVIERQILSERNE